MTHSNARKLILALVAGMTLFMWVMATPRRAATWYVAPDGNDNNPGTLAQPFASITRAQAAASAGDPVYIRGGTYTSFSDEQLLRQVEVIRVLCTQPGGR